MKKKEYSSFTDEDTEAQSCTEKLKRAICSPFTDEDTEAQSGFKKLKRAIYNFFSELATVWNEPVKKDCTEQETETSDDVLSHTETETPSPEQEKSDRSPLLTAITDSAIFTFCLMFFAALIPLAYWESAGEYSKGVILKGGAICIAFIFTISFGITYSALKQGKHQQTTASTLLGKLSVDILIVVLLAASAVGIYCMLPDEARDRMPYGSECKQLMETAIQKIDFFKEDLQFGAYSKIDTYEAKLTKISKTRINARDKYVYTVEGISEEPAILMDNGDFYRDLCKNCKEGEETPFPVDISVELMEKKGEQFYFCGKNRLERIS